jgi:hypothetical protein
LRLLPVQVEDSHIGRLRWSYPPLAYRFHLVGTGPERRAGLLGLVKLPPVWYYDLGLVNLSTIDVSAVEIEIQYAGKGEVFVDVGGSHLRFPDGTSPNESEYLRLIRGNGTTKLIMPRLNSGQGSRISIAIRSKSKPGFDDVTISPRCAEGAFSEITPIQWNAIGWKN